MGRKTEIIAGGISGRNERKIVFTVWILLALLCLVYGIAVGTVGSGTRFFTVWLGLAAVFAFFAIAVKKNLWGRLPGIIRKICLAAWDWLFSWLSKDV